MTTISSTRFSTSVTPSKRNKLALLTETLQSSAWAKVSFDKGRRSVYVYKGQERPSDGVCVPLWAFTAALEADSLELLLEAVWGFPGSEVTSCQKLAAEVPAVAVFGEQISLF